MPKYYVIEKDYDDPQNWEDWDQYDSSDPEFAAREHCDHLAREGAFYEGYPNGTAFWVTDGNLWWEVQIFTDFSPHFSGVEKSVSSPLQPEALG